jgi:hypothetical protein
MLNASVGELQTQVVKSFDLVKEELFVDIETQVVWYPENTMTFVITVYDESYTTIQPDSMNLTVYIGSPLLENVYLKSNLTDPKMQLVVENGNMYYVLSHVMPPTTPSGDYWAVVSVSKDIKSTLAQKPFRVARGGPYDLILRLLETEVYQEDYLDFEITIINMGEVGQDVFLEYWVQNGEQTWYYASESLYVPALENRTLLRNAYIFSAQPFGKYLLVAKLTFDVTQAPVFANATFMVVERIVPIVPPPVVPPPVVPPPVVPPVRNISIIEWPAEVAMMAGWTKYPSVKVKNIGEIELYNVRLIVTGIPSPWLKVSPELVEVLGVNETVTFSMEISIPLATKAGEYIVKLLALANETSDEKTMILRIFTSIEELIRWEISVLTSETQKFEMEVEGAREIGKDVEAVVVILESIKEQIELAKKYSEEKKYDDALASISTGWSLLRRGRELLAVAPFIKPIIVPVIPTWIVLLLVFLVVVILLSVIYLTRIRRFIARVMGKPVPEIEKVAKEVEVIEEKATLEDEAERLRGTLELLETQFREGIISESAYRELRKTNEEKLRVIEEKLEKLR